MIRAPRESCVIAVCAGAGRGRRGDDGIIALAAELLAAHGGHLSVSGPPDGASRADVGRQLVTNPRILVVDDDEESRALVRVALERERFSVLEAGDGAEALEVIANESPDLGRAST